jgi:hypothetical protein
MGKEGMTTLLVYWQLGLLIDRGFWSYVLSSIFHRMCFVEACGCFDENNILCKFFPPPI